jgi:hypothetical protein
MKCALWKALSDFLMSLDVQQIYCTHLLNTTQALICLFCLLHSSVAKMLAQDLFCLIP